MNWCLSLHPSPRITPGGGYGELSYKVHILVGVTLCVRMHMQAHARAHAHVGGRGTEKASMCLCLHWPVCVSVVLSAGERWRGCIWVWWGSFMCLWVSLGAGSLLLSYVPPSTCMNVSVCGPIWPYVPIYIFVSSPWCCVGFLSVLGAIVFPLWKRFN